MRTVKKYPKHSPSSIKLDSKAMPYPISKATLTPSQLPKPQFLAFGIKRVIVRCSVMVGVVFVAESVPSFGPMLDLVGGSAFTLTSVIFPCLFYIFLAAGEKKAEEAKPGSEEDETASFSE